MKNVRKRIKKNEEYAKPNEMRMKNLKNEWKNNEQH